MANFTKQAIRASFLKLLNEKPLGKISVKDINVKDADIEEIIRRIYKDGV